MLSLSATLLPTLLIACTSVQDNFSQQHAAEGVHTLAADIESGDLSYSAWGGDFDINWTSAAWGRDEELAASRQAGNRWDVRSEGGALSLFARSEAYGRVDFTVEGPRQVFADWHLESGDAELEGLAGYQVVHASDIRARDLVGGGEFIADTVDLELHPVAGDTVLIEARSVILELPPGRYDLAVWGSPESVLDIQDLGFHHTALGEGSFAGVSGDGATRVDVYATGDVTIRQGW